MMLTCAMCGKPMRECCDIYHVAKSKQGRECIICGDCAEELEAYAESQRKSAQEKRGMRCEACGAEINELITEFYDVKGNVYEKKVPIKYCEHNAVYFDVGVDWCGDGLYEEDIHDCIRCPKCGKPPFINHEVQTIIRVIRFTSEGASADA